MPGAEKKQRKEKPADQSPRVPLDLERSFGAALKRHRKAAGYSQEALGQRAEVHRTQISLIERGLRSPGVDVVTRLVGALGVEPNDLFEGAAWMPVEDGGRGRFKYATKKG